MVPVNVKGLLSTKEKLCCICSTPLYTSLNKLIVENMIAWKHDSMWEKGLWFVNESGCTVSIWGQIGGGSNGELKCIENQSPNPWHVSFSYRVLKTWKGQPENFKACTECSSCLCKGFKQNTLQQDILNFPVTDKWHVISFLDCWVRNLFQVEVQWNSIDWL